MGYHAFISYSHAADGKLVPALQVALEQYAKPWYRRRALHVFRDETNLSANPHLWQSILDNLSQAEWFILMASPDAAESKWVRREVEWWLEHRASSRILMVLTEGEVQWNENACDFDWERTTAIPQVLQAKFSGEAFIVRLQWAKSENSLTLQHTKFRQAVLQVAAPIHGLSPDEMDGEAVRIHRKNIGLAATLIAALVIMVGAAAWQWWEALQQKNAARAALASVDFNEGVRRAQSGRRSEALPFLASSIRFSTDSPGVRGALLANLTATRWPLSVMSHENGVKTASFSPDGTRVVTASWDKTARIWDARTGAPVGAPLWHKDIVWAASFSPDGTRVVTASTDGTARIWDAQTRAPVGAPLWREKEVRTASFSADGTRVVTASRDHTARIWDAQTGAPVGAPLRHEEGVSAASFSADG
jgi:hypothetical protein